MARFGSIKNRVSERSNQPRFYFIPLVLSLSKGLFKGFSKSQGITTFDASVSKNKIIVKQLITQACVALIALIAFP